MMLQGQHSGELFTKLKSLRVFYFEDDQITFPDWILENAPCLEILVVQWSSFKQIFQDDRLASKQRNSKICARLKKLSLIELPELKHICKEGSQIDPVLAFLEILSVEQCSNLKHLVPSSARFNYLIYLEVQSCGGLIDLFTSSTARSLKHLTTMEIRECSSLEQVVGEVGDDTMDEIALNIVNEEIIFGSLENLELTSLSSLISFCPKKHTFIFPSLVNLKVTGCPKMQSFTRGVIIAPLLTVVEVENGKKRKIEDLNTTIKKLFMDKIAFQSFKHLELSKYLQLRELWYEPIGHIPFSNLKSLVVQQCDWLSKVLLPLNIQQALPNLEELEVRDCDPLEAVFGLGGTDESALAVKVKETIQLKKITIANLANLKHIWKQDTQENDHVGDDYQGLNMSEAPGTENIGQKLGTWGRDPLKILGFQNLQAVTVEDCKDLEYLFPFSTFMGLQHLEEIGVRRCGIKEIVGKEGDMDKTATFVLNHLSSLVLRDLHELKGFCAGNYSLTCPSLKILSVSDCKKLVLFKTLSMSSQESGVQPLFRVEEVIPNLEALPVDQRSANIIMQAHSQSRNLFNKLKGLYLNDYEDDETTLPYWFLHNIPNLEWVFVRKSSFKVIFQDKEVEISTRIKHLELRELHELQTIYEEGSLIDPFLEVLFVEQCSSLKQYLMPSSARFSHLRQLDVEKCNGLIHLITSPTARSLINLRRMEIRECGSLEQLVIEEGDEARGEIAFESLEILKLKCLSSFKSFCSGKCTLIFPSLEKLTVTGCPKMQNFSLGVTIAPILTVVEVENGKKRWKQDLNTTIKQLFMEKQQEVAESDRS